MASANDRIEYFPFLKEPIRYVGIPAQEKGSETSVVAPFTFQYYNKDEVIYENRTMAEICRFACCYWHTFTGTGQDPFGGATLERPWNHLASEKGVLSSSAPLEPSNAGRMKIAKARADAAFEFFVKLGVSYYTFHDRDVAPEGESVEETWSNLQEMQLYLQKKQLETGVKLLWATANLFSHPRYMNGAGTSPEVDVFCLAATQIRQAMAVTHALGGANYVFWGGREGYQTILNTDMRQELDHLAALMHMAIAYKKEIGASFQLLIEPKPREPTKHQYDYDAMTVLAFLHTYGLQNDFKLNIEPNHSTLAGHEYEHDIMMASAFGVLGSIDCNSGDPLVGWDTDQFLMDTKKAAQVMSTVIKQGGLAPGGLNFDAKVRRESTNLEDMFIAHIGSMDCFAKGLRMAVNMRKDGQLDDMRKLRYASWKSSEIGKAIESGTATLPELERYAGKLEYSARPLSGQQELYELVFERTSQC